MRGPVLRMVTAYILPRIHSWQCSTLGVDLLPPPEGRSGQDRLPSIPTATSHLAGAQQFWGILVRYCWQEFIAVIQFYGRPMWHQSVRGGHRGSSWNGPSPLMWKGLQQWQPYYGAQGHPIQCVRSVGCGVCLLSR